MKIDISLMKFTAIVLICSDRRIFLRSQKDIWSEFLDIIGIHFFHLLLTVIGSKCIFAVIEFAPVFGYQVHSLILHVSVNI